MTYVPPDALARQAKALTDEVLAAQERAALLDFGNPAVPRIGVLATAVSLLAQAVEELADELKDL